MQRSTGLFFLILAALAIVLAGCGGGGSGAPGIPDGGSDGTVDTSGTVRVLLTDAPAADLSEVWVNILRIELVPMDGPIVTLESDALPAQFELLSLAANPVELGVIEAPAGAYEQVRLVLAADGNYLVDANGNQHYLKVPSGTETGVKVNFPDGTYEVTEGQSTLLLDFLAGPSVHQAGQSGQWIMRPVINGSTPDEEEPQFGSMQGTVTYEDGSIPQPMNGNPPAVFLDGRDAENIGEIDPETGEFEIASLLAGEYDVEIGWLDGEGEMDDAELSIVTGEGAFEEVEVVVERDATLNLELTVKPVVDDDAEGEENGEQGRRPDHEDGDDEEAGDEPGDDDEENGDESGDEDGEESGDDDDEENGEESGDEDGETGDEDGEEAGDDSGDEDGENGDEDGDETGDDSGDEDGENGDEGTEEGSEG